MVWGSLIAAGGSLLGGLLGNKGNRDVARINAEAALADQRIAGIEQLLSELSRTQLTDETTSALENIFGTEIAEQIVNETRRQQQEQQTSTDQTTTGQTTGTEERTTTRGNETTNQALNTLIGNLSSDNSGAAQSAVQAQVDRILREGSPAISNVLANSGGFDNTNAAILQNDLITKAAEAGASLQLAQDNTQRQQLLEAIAAGQVGTETSEAQTSEQQQEILQQLQNLVNNVTDESTQESSSTTTNEQTTQQETSAQQQTQEQQTQEQTGVNQQIIDKETDINGNQIPGSLGDLFNQGQSPLPIAGQQEGPLPNPEVGVPPGNETTDPAPPAGGSEGGGTGGSIGGGGGGLNPPIRVPIAGAEPTPSPTMSPVQQGGPNGFNLGSINLNEPTVKADAEVSAQPVVQEQILPAVDIQVPQTVSTQPEVQAQVNPLNQVISAQPAVLQQPVAPVAAPAVTAPTEVRRKKNPLDELDVIQPNLL